MISFRRPSDAPHIATPFRVAFFMRLRLRVRARQALFVFCLHLFTHLRQCVDCQCVRGEGFCASTFTRAAHVGSGGEGRKMGGVFTPNARAIRLLRPQREG